MKPQTNDSGRKIYSFSGFRLDADERLLSDGDRLIPMPPKVFDTLLLLVRNAGRVLAKDRLLAETWEDSFVEENNLAQNISFLRRILGETKHSKFIETVPKFGYRFVAPAETVNAAAGGSAFVHLAVSAVPETHYVRNGDVNIAYQTLGSGGVDIVFVMGWVSHLEYFWKHPLFASFLSRLASFSRLILFDKRGTGLSDRVPIDELPTLEQRMEDVHAVMDHVRSERAVLIGVSEGGPMCSLFAATYPERTAALIMIGTYAKRIRDDDYPWAPSAEDRDGFFEQLQSDWGKPVGIEERAPSMADDPAFRDWWSTYLRMGTSPGAAVALTKMNAQIDVRPILPSIRVPTLVIHRTGDLCLKVEEGRFVASKIPGAKFVELPGIDHLPFVGDQDAVIDEIESFLNGIIDESLHDRVLATVMSVDLTGSTARPDILDLVRGRIEYFRGREVGGVKDEVLAAFDGPARAIKCASAIADLVRPISKRIRIGVHTGECDVIGGGFGGVAVTLARSIALESEGGNILASRTVKDLVAGSGIVFENFGTRSFDGVEGQRQLYSIQN